MSETRRDKRAPVALKVRFKSATVDEFIEQYANDISRGGIFIKSKTPMAIGTLLKFEFQLKDESRLIHGVGRVVWKRDDSDPSRPAGMGIKFIKMDDESRTLVERVLDTREASEGSYDAGLPPTIKEEPAATPTTSRAPRETSPGISMSAALTASMNPPSRNETPTDPPPKEGFFPSSNSNDEMPAPEDRTQIRDASHFLAEALRSAGIDESTAAEARAHSEAAVKREEERPRVTSLFPRRAESSDADLERLRKEAAAEAANEHRAAARRHEASSEAPEPAVDEPPRLPRTGAKRGDETAKRVISEATKSQMKSEPPAPIAEKKKSTLEERLTGASILLADDVQSATNGRQSDPRELADRERSPSPPSGSSQTTNGTPEKKEAAAKEAVEKEAKTLASDSGRPREPAPPPRPEQSSIGTPTIAIAAIVVLGLGYGAYRMFGSKPAETDEPVSPTDQAHTEPSKLDPARVDPVVDPANSNTADPAGTLGSDPVANTVGTGSEVAVANGNPPTTVDAGSTAAPAPVGALASVRIETTPSGATISIAGRAIGTTPLSTQLPLGAPSQLELHLAGYAPMQTAYIPHPRNPPLRLQLVALPHVLIVDSVPPGARVNALGAWARAPGELVLSTAPRRPFMVQAQLPGFEPNIQNVLATGFEEQEGRLVRRITFTMRPRRVAPGPGTGPARPVGTEPGPGETPENPPERTPDPPRPTPTPAEPIPDNPFG